MVGETQQSKTQDKMPLYLFNLHQPISQQFVLFWSTLSNIKIFFNQEEEATFHPDMIKSDLLHAFLVVRPTPGGYKMAIVTRSVLRNTQEMSSSHLFREDVPEFGPQISEVKVHAANRHLRWVKNTMIKPLAEGIQKNTKIQ